MARAADVHLCVKVAKEACPLGLAPTSSTTATLVMGDALAVALLKARGFTAEDFALSHPGGALGRKLLLRVNDIMHTGDEIPHVKKTASLRDALLEVTRKNLGMTVICDDNMMIEQTMEVDSRADDYKFPSSEDHWQYYNSKNSDAPKRYAYDREYHAKPQHLLHIVSMATWLFSIRERQTEISTTGNPHGPEAIQHTGFQDPVSAG